MSIDGIPPISLRPIEAVQPHRRVEERSEQEKEPPERRGSDEGEDERDEDAEDGSGPHLDIRI